MKYKNVLQNLICRLEIKKYKKRNSYDKFSSRAEKRDMQKGTMEIHRSLNRGKSWV